MAGPATSTCRLNEHVEDDYWPNYAAGEYERMVKYGYVNGYDCFSHAISVSSYVFVNCMSEGMSYDDMLSYTLHPAGTQSWYVTLYSEDDRAVNFTKFGSLGGYRGPHYEPALETGFSSL